MPTIEETIILASKAHAGQIDKAGKPYIFHPLRIMLKMDGEEEIMSALLHDVVEDTPVTLSTLKELGYSENVLQAVEILTHSPDVEYFDYVRRCRTNKLARKVKEADASDNFDLTRILDPQEKDFARRNKYNSVLKLMRQYKNFYHDAKYENLFIKSKIVTEELFKIVESLGIWISPEFVNNEMFILKTKDNSGYSLLSALPLETGLEVTLYKGRDLTLNLTSNNIKNDQILQKLKILLTHKESSS